MSKASWRTVGRNYELLTALILISFYVQKIITNQFLLVFSLKIADRTPETKFKFQNTCISFAYFLYFFFRCGSKTAAQNGANKKKSAPKATPTTPTSQPPPAAAPRPQLSPPLFPTLSIFPSACANPSTPLASGIRLTCCPATCPRRRPTTAAHRHCCHPPSACTPRPVRFKRFWRIFRRRNGRNCPRRSLQRRRHCRRGHQERRGLLRRRMSIGGARVLLVCG